MKRAGVLVLIAMLLLTAAIASPAAAQAEFTCNDGSGVVVTNGVEFTANVRPGEYRATVVGLNGFDPVIAVIETEVGGHLCNDDEPLAAAYAGELPTTGPIPPSGLSAQMDFTNTGSDFMDVTILVGGLNGQPGEFILLFQGMQVTDADGEGDPFAINASPNVVNSGVGINAYTLHVDSSFDPLMLVVDENNEVVEISSGAIACDDASNSDACWTAGDPLVSLEGFGLTDGENTVVADPYDPYIAIPTSLLDASLEHDSAWINYLVTGAQYQQGMSTGSYVFAIHTGTAGDGSSSASGSTGNVIPLGQPGGPVVTEEPGGSSTTVADAVPLECNVTGQQIEGDVNTYLNVECPANCAGGLWGTTIYTDDSSVCTAAVHAGVIPASGGQFSLVIAEGQTSYEGSTANGITSSNWGQWQRSIMPVPLLDESGPSTNTSSNSGNASADVTLQPIAYGDSIDTQYGSASGDAWVFSASARDVVTIAVTGASDPLIIVTDASGRELTRDDDSGPGFNALVSNLRIPNDGQYIILVTSFTGEVEPGAPYAIELSGG